MATEAATGQALLTHTECAVLGLLTRGPRSGYELLRDIEQSVGFFWSPARSQLYAVLPKLEARGLATAERIEQDRRPDKRVYQITEPGRTALREGLAQVHGGIDRNPFQLVLFFGEHADPEALHRMIESKLERSRQHLATLEQIETTFDHDEHFHPWLTLLLGKEDARAQIRWAEQALSLLAERQT